MKPAAAVDDSHFQVHFGGPDHPPGALRNLLAERVAGMPGDGTIDWATYYFRDRPLAQALVAVRKRGVEVRLVMEGRPRTGRANDAVIACLAAADGLGDRMRVVQMPRTRYPYSLKRKHPRLHEKIYCFSHPVPTAFVGSFNPSGDHDEEDPETIEEIGDHNVAHNMLVEIRHPAIVECLTAHVRALHAEGPWWPRRRTNTAKPDHDFGDTQVHFWPRRDAHPVERLLERYGDAGSRLRIAASHISLPQAVACLERVARNGARVEIVAEHTARRVPPEVEQRLTAAGITFVRLGAQANVPMHLKFVLAEGRHGRHAVFGSFNWTRQSYWLNHEIAVITRDASVFDALERRWEMLH